MKFAHALLLAWLVAAPATAQPPIVDGDADGVSDEIDACPYSAPRVVVGADGCEGPPDSDLDGIPDGVDDCPGTPPDSVVDPFGCAPPAADCGAGCDDDYDGDGIADAADACPYSQPGSLVEADGCAIDTDFDGIPDGIDRCPRTPLRQTPDDAGCSVGQAPGPTRTASPVPAPAVATIDVSRPRAGADSASAAQLIRQPERTVRRLLARLQVRALASGMRAPGTGIAIAGSALDALPTAALSDAVPVQAEPEREVTRQLAAAEPEAPPPAPSVIRRSPQTRALELPIVATARPAPDVTPSPEPAQEPAPAPAAVASLPAETQFGPATAPPLAETDPRLAPLDSDEARALLAEEPPPAVRALPPAPLRLVPVREDSAPPVTVTGLRISFVRGSAELDGRIMASLREAMPAWRRTLLSEPAAQLQVRADTGGNAALAETRARIVRAFLMALGLPGSQLLIETGRHGGDGSLELVLSAR